MALQRFHSKKVHPYWFRLLRHAQKDGVRFHLNSGKRTIAKQWQLYRKYKRDGWPVAAFPSPFAPHIRKRHAVDVDGSQALINWAAKHGVRLWRTVPGESWHLEADWGQLKRHYRKHSPRRRR